MRKFFCPLSILFVVILVTPNIVHGWGCKDKDGDGHYAISPYCPEGDDCNDCDPTVYPGASEVCDGKDNNCDGQVDEGCCEDKDGDGHYAISANCPQGNDCNDSDPTIYPGASEICDGKDNNCNGQVDEGLSTDADGDGHYTSDSCKTPNDDCNDADPTIYPGATESCDGKDNNCDGVIDEGCCIDNDNDGFYAYSENCPEGNDCNDNDPLVYPDNGGCCLVPHLTPLTDPLSIRLEGGEVLVEGFLTQRMQEAVNCFRNAVRSVGGSIHITSGYRTPEYNNHLREVWDRYYDLINEDTLLGTECDSLRNEITAEFERHRLVYRPGTRHATGIAIDASVTLPTGQNVDTLADSCNLYRPFSNDRVHFELRR